jgi:hypothetical protein
VCVLHVQWAISLILFILEIVLWVLFIGVPWGFGESFGRPICEENDADHWITPFQRTTQGGWKKDYGVKNSLMPTHHPPPNSLHIFNI